MNGVNNAILVEGDPIGRVMFYGPGAGQADRLSRVADILNIAGIRQASGDNGSVDPLLAAGSWRPCVLADSSAIRQRHYVRLNTKDAPGVIGKVGSCFGDRGVSIQSIVQFNASAAGAEIVVITHEVSQGQVIGTGAITALPEVSGQPPTSAASEQSAREHWTSLPAPARRPYDAPKCQDPSQPGSVDADPCTNGSCRTSPRSKPSKAAGCWSLQNP